MLVASPLDLQDTKPLHQAKEFISVQLGIQQAVVSELVEVILNGNKVLKRTIRETEQKYEPTIVEEKQDRGNEMKAKGTLLMALPNKDQLKFHSYNDLKLLMEAIEKRYGGNKESKKVQRTLLKQQYENFAGSSSETMDQTFDRLQKLISQLEIQGEVITQEDMNLKLLRSLPSKWKTHALIWRNKEELRHSRMTSLQSTATAAPNEADKHCFWRVSGHHTQCYPTSGGEDLRTICSDDLGKGFTIRKMAMLTIRGDEEEGILTNFGIDGTYSLGSSSSSDFGGDYKKGITTRSGVAYQGPTIPTTSSSPPKVVECETEVTKDMMPPTNNGSTKDVQPPVVQV
ncbi:hypothetical protein Tco_0421178 [Tanacetum coccineum]